jgi:threonine synthase
MDILISSNLERLLYFTAGSDRTAKYMRQLKETGCYTVDAEVLAEIQENFVGYCASEEETAATIHRTFGEQGYLSDTHTAVAIHAAECYIKDSGDTLPMVVDSTASPYKFANNVYSSVTGKEPSSELEALNELSAKTNTEIPYPLAGLAERKVNFTDVCEKTEMASRVLDYVG